MLLRCSSLLRREPPRGWAPSTLLPGQRLIARAAYLIPPLWLMLLHVQLPHWEAHTPPLLLLLQSLCAHAHLQMDHLPWLGGCPGRYTQLS